MAAGVSISDAMLLPLLLMSLLGTLATPPVNAVAFGSAFSSAAVDPFSDYLCPKECMCYKVNVTGASTAVMFINCTVPFFSPHIAPMINEASHPLTTYAVFTCSYGLVDYTDTPPESTLWEGAFRNMSQLKVLTFDNCKFKALSRYAFRGITFLTELAIRGAEIDQIDHALLSYLPRLTHLEVTGSGLTHFIPVCDASSLRVLNVSGNHLLTLQDAGIHCDQLLSLETLDVKRNYITEIPEWLHKSLPNLYHLNLADNYLSKSSESPFQNLTKLLFLDLSNNSFTHFDSNFLKGSNNLLLLGLSGNRVSALPLNILADLSVLGQLEIGDMGLDDRVWTEIIGVRQLVQLNISYNQLTSIHANIMGQFLRMESCYLDHNKISSFPSGAFDYQYTLGTLDLSHNNIPGIPPNAFRSQYVLRHLHLQHNNISSIGYDAFTTLKELQTLDISYNSIPVLPPKAFTGLLKLTHIDLSSNNLTTVENNLFSKSLQISYLNVSHNHLTDVPLLNNLQSLKTVDISYNNISSLNPSLFLELEELTTVIGSHNDLTSLPMKLFKGCENLKHVDFSHNSIKFLDEATFSSIVHLETVDLSHNFITDFHTIFSGLKHLMILDLSHNKITKILRGQFPLHVERINLKNNQISLMSAHTFKSLRYIKNVDLRGNKLTSLNKRDVEIAFGMLNSPVFHLHFNPFICDCHLGWLKDWSLGSLKDMLTLPTFNVLGGLSCTSPFHTFRLTLQQLSRSEFLCNYTVHCEESCMCCDYDACYCKYICPNSCQCFIGDDNWHVHHVMCNSVGLSSIPPALPEGATDLRLDGNDIPVLKRHAFLALKHVESLYLNNSRIHTIQNNTFKGLKAVKKLFLNDNHLTAIYAVTFKGLDNLEELYLQNNDIYSIESQAFSTPPFLSSVNLQGNALVNMPLEELWQFTNRTANAGLKPKLYLSGNPWSCDPDFVCKFLQFAQANSDSIQDISYIECIPMGTTEKPLPVHQDATLLLDYHPALCGNNQTNYENMTGQSVEAPSSNTETYALIAACIIVAFAIALLIVAYFNRHLLQVFCFTRFGFRVFKQPKAADDNERPYDAFISYSNKDEEFVIRQLAPRLENGDKKFRLCVHYRDFPVGACIAETIVRSVEASKRTILVVSDNFLDSEWCRFEFQTAHQQVLNERRNRVILILMHDLDSEKLDDTLRVYMRTRTYLKYDDPWFWEKLMFAMPDIRHRKTEMPSRLPSSRDLEYMVRDMGNVDPQQQQQQQQQHQQQHHHHPTRNGSRCETIHNDMYEIPVMDSPSVHYQLANGVCSTHTNTAYHNSDGSDSTSGYHNGSLCESCGHYEEVGPGSSIHSTPQKQIGTPPPVPSIPKEGFIPRDKLRSFKA